MNAAALLATGHAPPRVLTIGEATAFELQLPPCAPPDLAAGLRTQQHALALTAWVLQEAEDGVSYSHALTGWSG
jgi:hypothetical protein